jgi:hypothetical protein
MLFQPKNLDSNFGILLWGGVKAIPSWSTKCIVLQNQKFPLIKMKDCPKTNNEKTCLWKVFG